jgi:hypothetical protein
VEAVKVRVTLTLDVDADAWATDYGITRDQVRADVVEAVTHAAHAWLRDNGMEATS